MVFYLHAHENTIIWLHKNLFDEWIFPFICCLFVCKFFVEPTEKHFYGYNLCVCMCNFVFYFVLFSIFDILNEYLQESTSFTIFLWIPHDPTEKIIEKSVFPLLRFAHGGKLKTLKTQKVEKEFLNDFFFILFR